MLPGLGKRLEPGGDVDAIAEDIAVLDYDVAEIDPDAHRDAALGESPRFGRATASRNAAAQRTASTTLSNSISTASPVRLKMFPPNSRSRLDDFGQKELLSPGEAVRLVAGRRRP